MFPILFLISLCVSIVAGGKLIWDRFTPLQWLYSIQSYLIRNAPKWVEKLLIWIGEGIIWAFGELMKLIGQFFEFMLDKAIETAEAVVKEIGKILTKIKEEIEKILDKIKSFASEIVGKVENGAKDTIDAVGKFGQKIGDDMITETGKVVKKVGKIGEKITDDVSSGVTQAVNAIPNAGKKVIEDVTGGASQAVDQAGKAATKVITDVGDVGNNAFKGIENLGVKFSEAAAKALTGALDDMQKTFSYI